MDRLAVSFVILLVSFFGQSGNAQSSSSNHNSLPEETLSISLSDDLIVSGSGLFFQVVATTEPGQRLSKLSRIAEIALFNAAGEKVLFQKLQLNKGVGSGKFFISPSLPSGEYSMLVATGWSMNNKKNPQFAKNELLIINPFQHLNQAPLQDSIVLAYNTVDFSTSSKDNVEGGVTLKTNKKNYSKRERVQIEIANNSLFERPFVLNVKRVKPIEIKKPGSERRIINSADEYFVPEVRGDVIQGFITSKKANLKKDNQLISLSIPGKNYAFKISRTNANGEFVFYLDENEYLYEKLHLNVVRDHQEDMQIKLQNSITDFIHPVERELNLRVDERLKNWIEFQNAANQIENAYYETKTEKVNLPSLKDPFYYPLGFVYKLDDYKRFPTVNQTFIEVINRAAIRKQGENYIFKTFNYNEEEKIDGIDKLHPLILIDGFKIEDNNILVDFDVDRIASITIVPDNYRYGSELFAGIIDVATKNGDYLKKDEISTFNHVYPSPETSVYQPVYSVNDTLSRIPDYRTTLFWNPEINLSTPDLIKEEFYTSDIEGWYEIVLSGYNNNGERVEIIKHIRVE